MLLLRCAVVGAVQVGRVELAVRHEDHVLVDVRIGPRLRLAGCWQYARPFLREQIPAPSSTDVTGRGAARGVAVDRGLQCLGLALALQGNDDRVRADVVAIGRRRHSGNFVAGRARVLIRSCALDDTGIDIGAGRRRTLVAPEPGQSACGNAGRRTSRIRQGAGVDGSRERRNRDPHRSIARAVCHERVDDLACRLLQRLDLGLAVAGRDLVHRACHVDDQRQFHLVGAVNNGRFGRELEQRIAASEVAEDAVEISNPPRW